jgi:hypothetical protein
MILMGDLTQDFLKTDIVGESLWPTGNNVILESCCFNSWGNGRYFDCFPIIGFRKAPLLLQGRLKEAFRV